MSLAERRRCVSYLKERYEISERRACQAMQMNRSSYRYAPREEAADAGFQRTVALSRERRYWGYRKIHALLRREGVSISRERVRLIRRREGLQVPTKRRKRRRLGTTTQWVHRARHPNHVWSYDFMYDRTEDGRQLKILTVVDEFTRHALALVVRRSLSAVDVVTTLKDLFQKFGKPACLRSDNGPELVSQRVKQWLGERHVGTHYIDPGSPWQNAYNESFNAIYRTTCLDQWLFTSLTEARVVSEQWRSEYNGIRPHGSLDGLSPDEFLRLHRNKDHFQQSEILTA